MQEHVMAHYFLQFQSILFLLVELKIYLISVTGLQSLKESIVKINCLKKKQSEADASLI